MFNSALKKDCLNKLDSAVKEYENSVELVQSASMELYKLRNDSIKTIENVENYINSIANTPKEFEKTFEEVKVNIKRFSSILDLKLESGKAAKLSGSVAGAGVVTGVGVAAFGPTAAMAIATTFGTAGTGTAISALSGAAATNAALAWLGGGVVAAGGGGMAAGETFLALAGPIGWAIGGAALIGGGMIASSKNKKVAEKAQSEAAKVKKRIAAINAIMVEIKEIKELTKAHVKGVEDQLRYITAKNIENYKDFTQSDKAEAGALVNNTLALSKLLNRVVGEE